jgi:ribose-phosphate pyrophosphokinase
MSTTAPFVVFSGTKSRYLAEEICDSLGCPLGNMNVTRFADGEFAVSYEESIRGKDVFLVQSTFPGTDNLMELLLMIDAASRASARNVIAVIPYYGWARQDRKDKPRVCIASKLIADMITVAGADRVITMDLHADQIQGFFNIPVDHLYASNVFAPYIQNLDIDMDNIVIATPDVGGSKRAATYAKWFNAPLVLCNKTRVCANVVESIQIIGEVEDKDVMLLDDIVDTAGTITAAANEMKKAGARSVRAFASHCVMSDPATKRINESLLEEIVFTNSIPYDLSRSPRVRQLSVAPMFAETIHRIVENKPISEQYLIQKY